MYKNKILGSWSGMRKYLENEMIAENLRGRVRYNCTSYVGMDGCRVFEIFIDNELVKRFSYETVNSYFIEKKLKKNNEPYGQMEYWADFWKLLNQIPIESRPEHTDFELCEALKEYRNQDIKDSINSENPLVRMFAVLDRRLGKRTLENVKGSVENQPEWLQIFYRLRLGPENYETADKALSAR